MGVHQCRLRRGGDNLLGCFPFLEGKGAAVRYATQFREYALMRKRHSAQERIQLLAKSDLLRHLPPEAIEDLLPCIQTLNKRAGDVVFRAGEAGDALYIVASGTVEVIAGAEGDDIAARRIAQLTEGETFGEMALLAGGVRTATVRAVENIQLLKISKLDFQRLIASDYYLAQVIERISHARAISNLTTSNVSPEIWAKVANQSLDRVSRHEANIGSVDPTTTVSATSDTQAKSISFISRPHFKALQSVLVV